MSIDTASQGIKLFGELTDRHGRCGGAKIGHSGLIHQDSSPRRACRAAKATSCNAVGTTLHRQLKLGGSGLVLTAILAERRLTPDYSGDWMLWQSGRNHEANRTGRRLRTFPNCDAL